MRRIRRINIPIAATNSFTQNIKHYHCIIKQKPGCPGFSVSYGYVIVKSRCFKSSKLKSYLFSIMYPSRTSPHVYLFRVSVWKIKTDSVSPSIWLNRSSHVPQSDSLKLELDCTVFKTGLVRTIRVSGYDSPT